MKDIQSFIAKLYHIVLLPTLVVCCKPWFCVPRVSCDDCTDSLLPTAPLSCPSNLSKDFTESMTGNQESCDLLLEASWRGSIPKSQLTKWSILYAQTATPGQASHGMYEMSLRMWRSKPRRENSMFLKHQNSSKLWVFPQEYILKRWPS